MDDVLSAAPDVAALAGLATYVVAGALASLARRAGWSRTRRAWVARLAPALGGALGYGLGAALHGLGWQGVLHGAIGGAAAVWAHQSRPRAGQEPSAPEPARECSDVA